MAFDAAALDGVTIGRGITLLSGDCRTVLPTLAANSVQCCVTSPPYYGLRDYGTAQWDGGDAECDHRQRMHWYPSSSTLRAAGKPHHHMANSEVSCPPYTDTCRKCGARRIDAQIGLEATPDEYIAQMVAVFREVRRVLRPDGVAFVNLGDAYAHGKPGGGSVFDNGRTDGRTFYEGDKARGREKISTLSACAKPKDLMMMPARVALALQADGWWLRSAIVWAKPNPMPESVTDRPTSAYEMVYLLAKRSRYYYDSDAIAEPATNGERFHGAYDGGGPNVRTSTGNGRDRLNNTTATRSCRNVWTIATSPFSAAHFATFPPELAERCIKAGTSERGCCAACGAPWVRQADVAYERTRTGTTGRADAAEPWGGGNKPQLRKLTTTTGWAPSCTCDAAVVPCTILDPFAGAGTALLVADRLQRNAIGIELNTAYTTMAMERCRADAPLFSSWPPAEDPADQRMAADAMQRDLFGC